MLNFWNNKPNRLISEILVIFFSLTAELSMIAEHSPSNCDCLCDTQRSESYWIDCNRLWIAKLVPMPQLPPSQYEDISNGSRQPACHRRNHRMQLPAGPRCSLYLPANQRNRPVLAPMWDIRNVPEHRTIYFRRAVTHRNIDALQKLIAIHDKWTILFILHQSNIFIYPMMHRIPERFPTWSRCSWQTIQYYPHSPYRRRSDCANPVCMCHWSGIFIAIG